MEHGRSRELAAAGYLHAFAQEVLAAQQLKRNTELFEAKAVPLRVLETSQTEARQASIAAAERH